MLVADREEHGLAVLEADGRVRYAGEERIRNVGGREKASTREWGWRLGGHRVVAAEITLGVGHQKIGNLKESNWNFIHLFLQYGSVIH